MLLPPGSDPRQLWLYSDIYSQPAFTIFQLRPRPPESPGAVGIPHLLLPSNLPPDNTPSPIINPSLVPTYLRSDQPESYFTPGHNFSLSHFATSPISPLICGSCVVRRERGGHLDGETFLSRKIQLAQMQRTRGCITNNKLHGQSL